MSKNFLPVARRKMNNGQSGLSSLCELRAIEVIGAAQVETGLLMQPDSAAPFRLVRKSKDRELFQLMAAILGRPDRLVSVPGSDGDLAILATQSEINCARLQITPSLKLLRSLYGQASRPDCVASEKHTISSTKGDEND